MKYFYWDASALVKRYVPELGTPLVNDLFARVERHRMMCLAIGTGEVVSIFVRKKNADIITTEAFVQALVDFRAEVIDAAGFNIASLNDHLVFASYSLIERYSLNATDALILQSTLRVAATFQSTDDDVVLVTSDLRLRHAALTEGVLTLNPETDTQAQLDTLI